MSLNPATAIDRFGAYHTVLRRDAETIVNGIKVVDSTPQTLSVFMSVQPVSGSDLRNLPEAQNGEEVRVARSYDELRARTATTAPDVVTVDGAKWTVVRVQKWPRHYCSYLARRSL